jgi:hypothetical protein
VKRAIRPEKPKAAAPMSPGDEAPPDTPGTGEDICRECNGRGKTARGERCRNCEGTGRVVRAIGGA